MKKILLLLGILISFLPSSAQTTITVLDSLVFHDGYAGLVSTPPPPAGVIKHRNDLFARKLTVTELLSIGSTLQMQVIIKALCDNYDRIGNVNMAFVPAGDTTYSPANVQRIELGRYITPFMNKNSQPDTVPFTFNIDNVTMIMKDTSITNSFDIWIELELFGVPYAAQAQVGGCSARNDVFYGTLKFITNSPAPAPNTNVLIPLFFKRNFNNYQVGATDTIGKTTKSISFNVPDNLTDAAFFLITSNHGANSGGEEYNRRDHFVYFNDVLRYTYKPGRLTCEPFRVYNTQGNGIYGSSPRTPAQWQSFSNWCPGDVIDIRRINLGPLAAGSHTFMITVPSAIFTGAEGNFPLSLYFQGTTSGILAVEENNEASNLFSVYPNPAENFFTVESNSPHAMKEIILFNMLGEQVFHAMNVNAQKEIIQISGFSPGLYMIQINTEAGRFVKKLQVQN